MSDMLSMEKLNALEHPLYVKRFGDGDWTWPVVLICVETGMSKMDVMGRSQNFHFSDVRILYDAGMNEYDPETFYMDYNQ